MGADAVNVRDDDRSDGIEDDPRWEVQPDFDDESGGSSRRRLMVLLMIGLLVAFVAWRFLGVAPGS